MNEERISRLIKEMVSYRDYLREKDEYRTPQSPAHMIGKWIDELNCMAEDWAEKGVQFPVAEEKEEKGEYPF